MQVHKLPQPSRRPASPSVVLLAALLGTFGCREKPSEVPETIEREPGEDAVPPVIEEADEPEATPEVSDAGITNAVNHELLLDHVTPGHEIQVATSEGIVELTGTLDNLLAKTRATRIAEVVKGVRSVSNRIEVQSKDVPDAELRENVEDALLFDPVTESYELDVAASDGAITLTGEVGSWAEKQIAEQVAASTRGVEQIENNIEVRYEQERSDPEILREVQRRLANDVLVDHEQIDVSVDDGKVTLTGIVGSAAERTRATAEAWTAGVEAVDSDGLDIVWLGDDPNLRDRGFVLESEEEIAAAIRDAMLYDPRVMAFEITPAVRGTSVTLQGTVDNLEAKLAAEQLARNTVGVARVVNEIEVDAGAEGRDDKQIADAIRSRLLTNVHTDAYDISVDVEDGLVTLTGTVDSYFEKAEAADLAARARGVTLVSNLLQVEDTEYGFYYDPYIYPYHPYIGSWRTYTPTATALNDEDLEDSIESELFWSPFVDEHQVQVHVEDGEATLTGTVDTWREREAATENAFEGGALYVDNLLHVEL